MHADSNRFLPFKGLTRLFSLQAIARRHASISGYKIVNGKQQPVFNNKLKYACEKKSFARSAYAAIDPAPKCCKFGKVAR